MEKKEIVGRFVCPGCVNGSSPECGLYKPGPGSLGCSNHVCGTMKNFQVSVALGMPKGFDGCARVPGKTVSESTLPIFIWREGTHRPYDNLNVPVWAQEIDGFLFVRWVSPRIGLVQVDIIEGGTLDMAPGARDVATFADMFD